MLRDHIFDTNAPNFCRTTVFRQTFKKLCESNNFVILYFKGLVFAFYLNRKENKGWLVAL